MSKKSSDHADPGQHALAVAWGPLNSGRNRRRLLLAVALTLPTLLGLPVARAAEPLKIGLVVPLSGPFAAYGKQIQHGVQLYLDQSGGNLAGRKVQLIVKDDNPGTSGDIT